MFFNCSLSYYFLHILICTFNRYLLHILSEWTRCASCQRGKDNDQEKEPALSYIIIQQGEHNTINTRLKKKKESDKYYKSDFANLREKRNPIQSVFIEHLFCVRHSASGCSCQYKQNMIHFLQGFLVYQDYLLLACEECQRRMYG